MIPFRRRGDDPHALIVGMTGLKMADRFLQIGCAHGGRLAALAKKVGLSGRAVVVVPDEAAGARARKGAEQSGALVEVELAPITKLPFDDGTFDLAVIDDTGALISSLRQEDRVLLVREAYRVLREGGRVMVIGTAPRGGLGALFNRAPALPRFDAAPLLEADGFRSPRTLAEREGLVFVEAMKPRR